MTTEVDPFNPNATADSEFGGMDDAEAMAFLRGGNVAAVWPTVGFKVGGTILSWEMRDQRKDGEKAYFVAGELKAEKDTPPHMRTKANAARQLKVSVQSEATGKTWKTNRYVEESIPDDDGIRDFWVKSALKAALMQALKEARVPFIEKGGYLEFERTPDGVAKDKSKGAPFTFKARYVPAAQNRHWTRMGGVNPESGGFGAPVTEADPFA